MKLKRSYSLSDLIVTIICVCFLTVNLAMIGSGGRRRAKEAFCLSKLRQWGQIFTAFVTDNEGYYAMTSGWCDDLSGYYDDSRLLLCPEATVPGAQGMRWRYAAWEQDDILGSYCTNRHLHDGPGDGENWQTPYQLLASQIPVLGGGIMDSSRPYHSDNCFEIPDDILWDWFGPVPEGMKRFCVNRHNGGPNLLFMDNSVRKAGMKELWELPWHRNWNPNNDPPTDYPDWPEWMANFKEYYQP